MAAKLEKTSTPGIFKRGNRYVVIYRDAGQTAAGVGPHARRGAHLRARRAASVVDGSYQPQTRERFADYALAWVEPLPGQRPARVHGGHPRGVPPGPGALRDPVPRPAAAGADHAAPHRGVHRVAVRRGRAGRRCAEERREARPRSAGAGQRRWAGGRAAVHLADATVRRILSPVRACLGTATAEGLIRHNPTRRRGAAREGRSAAHRSTRTTSRTSTTSSAERRRSSPMLLESCPRRHRLLFELLAATGCGSARRWRCDGATSSSTASGPSCGSAAPREGRFKPPKSRYGRAPSRSTSSSCGRSGGRVAAPSGPESAISCSPAATATPLDYGNLHRRVLKPAAEEAGVPWAGFHTLRHTCASRLFAQGRNAVQVQRWLGHHSPAFTLATLRPPARRRPRRAAGAPRVSAGVSATHGASRNEPESIPAKPRRSGL